MCCGTWPKLIFCLVMGFSYGFRAQVLGGTWALFSSGSYSLLLRFRPVFLQKKNRTKKRTAGAGLVALPSWFGLRPGTVRHSVLQRSMGGRRVSWARGLNFFDGDFAAAEVSVSGVSFDGCGSWLDSLGGTGRPFGGVWVLRF